MGPLLPCAAAASGAANELLPGIDRPSGGGCRSAALGRACAGLAGPPSSERIPGGSGTELPPGACAIVPPARP